MTEPWERGENLSQEKPGPWFFLEIDGSAPLFEMPPILPLCPFLSSAVHLFGHLDNLYSSSLPTRSLNDKSHGHWKSTLAKVTASLAEPPSPLPPTPPWGPAWGSRLFETPPSHQIRARTQPDVIVPLIIFHRVILTDQISIDLQYTLSDWICYMPKFDQET